MAVKKISIKLRPLAKKIIEEKAELPLVRESSMINKLRNPKVFIPLALIVLAIALFYFKGLFIAALVNGQPIARLSVVQELEKATGAQALSSMITQILIQQEAQKKNITATEDEINKMVKDLEDQLKQQGQTLDTALSFQKMTKDDLKKQLMVRKLVEKIFEKEVKVAEKEIDDFLAKNKDTIPEGSDEKKIRKDAKIQLEQQKLSEKVQPWLADLQKKAKIQHFVNY